MSGIHIPRPCPVGEQSLSPVEGGWHCNRCRHEVVDFTCMSEAEVLAYLVARPGQRVCGQLAAPRVVPRHPKQPRGPRHWLLAALVLLSVSSAAARTGLPPHLLPHQVRLALWQPGRIVVRGTVLDDSLGTPVAGAYVFIKGTRYGAVTGEQGEFSLLVGPGGGLDRGGQLRLEIVAGYFTFVPQTVSVSPKAAEPLRPLVVRLRYQPRRGYLKGKVKVISAPLPLPDSPPK